MEEAVQSKGRKSTLFQVTTPMLAITGTLGMISLSHTAIAAIILENTGHVITIMAIINTAATGTTGTDTDGIDTTATEVAHVTLENAINGSTKGPVN